MSLCYFSDQLLAPPAAESDGESDGSDRVPVPNFQNSFSQAFEKALLQLGTGGAPPPQAPVEPGLWPVHSHSAEQYSPSLKLSVITAHVVFAFAVQLIFILFAFRRERRQEEEEEAEAPVQHFHGPHKVEDPPVHAT